MLIEDIDWHSTAHVFSTHDPCFACSFSHLMSFINFGIFGGIELNFVCLEIDLLNQSLLLYLYMYVVFPGPATYQEDL